MPTPRKPAPRIAATVIDGFLCCSSALGANWCGEVHADIHDALLCHYRHLATTAQLRYGLPRSIFEGQVVEREGRREVQAIQRSNTWLRWNKIDDIEKRLGIDANFGVSTGVGTPNYRFTRHPVEVLRAQFARAAKIMEGEIARLGPDGMLTRNERHYGADGQYLSVSELRQIEREEKAKAARPATMTRMAHPARAVRSSPRAKRAA